MSNTASDFYARTHAPVVPRAHLFVVMNCANPFDAPSRHGIDGLDEVHIGRAPCREAVRRNEGDRRNMSVLLADRHVSSCHARLVRHQNGWVFEDLGSKNGSLLNGVPARSAPVADGDCLQVGHTFLILREAAPTPANAPLDLLASGRVPAFATLLPLLARELDVLTLAAPSTMPVLLVSETGTGKELLARAVHDLSRRKGDFVAVNCGALPAMLVESTLFGHKRGAFSGAVAHHAGLFRAAAGGTILLDEVGDMPPAAQAAVLRTLQDGEVLPVGATTPLHVDVRVIAATHHDLPASVAKGSFREDLLARLSGFTFCLPPLRARREDIGLIAGALLRGLAVDPRRAPELSPEVGWALLRYAWPRNVRELERCLGHAWAVAEGGRIEVEHLPGEVRAGDSSSGDGAWRPSAIGVDVPPATPCALPNVAPKQPRMAAGQRTPVSMSELQRALSEAPNMSEAAHMLRIHRSHLYRLLRRFGLEGRARPSSNE